MNKANEISLILSNRWVVGPKAHGKAHGKAGGKAGGQAVCNPRAFVTANK